MSLRYRTKFRELRLKKIYQTWHTECTCSSEMTSGRGDRVYCVTRRIWDPIGPASLEWPAATHTLFMSVCVAEADRPGDLYNWMTSATDVSFVMAEPYTWHTHLLLTQRLFSHLQECLKLVRILLRTFRPCSYAPLRRHWKSRWLWCLNRKCCISAPVPRWTISRIQFFKYDRYAWAAFRMRWTMARMKVSEYRPPQRSCIPFQIERAHRNSR